MQRTILIILATVAATILADLTGYARARQQWRDRPTADSSLPPPTFDWPLFAVRVAIGLLTGAMTALGVNQTNQPGGA